MRKILLATTAMVAFAGAAQAAESPLNVTVGGYVDFRAAHFDEDFQDADRRNHDFETEWLTSVEATGKAGRNIEYGALISMWNGSDYTNDWNGGGANVNMKQGYVWLTGGWGKVMMGDTHGVTDLFVYAPTVGEGQFDGAYNHFTDTSTLARVKPTFTDNEENDTKVVYYTPKVGNENHKFQAGVNYTPNAENQGQSVVKYDTANYNDVFGIAAQYDGKWSYGIGTRVSALLSTGSTESNVALQDYTSWGLGADISWNGFTVGGSYVDGGEYGAYDNQDEDQSAWTVGVKYDFDKVAVAGNYMSVQGYNNALVAGTPVYADNDRYVDSLDVFGLGATYTWFPGLTTAVDAVIFSQDRDDAEDNDGHVVMLSQKLAF